MTTTTTSLKHSSARSGPGIFATILDRISGNLQRRRAHAALASLDDRMLRDIGMTRAQIENLQHRG